MKLFTKFKVAFAVAVLSLSLANAQNGMIRVTIFDGETGETMIGAAVVIVGTNVGGVADLDGKASIRNLAAGTYDIEASFVSYDKKRIEGIVLGKGETKTFEISLFPESSLLEEIVVTAEVAQDSEGALLTVQKKSAKLLDAISSDMFSRNGDSDAASAVKRVVGVTVESGKYVYVRGLGDRYSKAILNGAEIPGLDPERNSVQLDLFPSNLIDNIVVYKTFSPDLPGEFSGGLVDITTKDFPDRFTMQVSASAGFNDQATFNNRFLTYGGSNTDFLGFDNGARDLPDLLAQYDLTTFPQRFISPNEEVTAAARAFENTQLEPRRASQLFNHGLSFSIGNQKNVFGKPFGFVAGLTYRRNYNFYDDGRVVRYQGISENTTDLISDITFTNDDIASEDEVTIGALANMSYKLSDNNKIGLNLMLNQGGTKGTRFQEGFRIDNAPDSTNINQIRVLSWTERQLLNGQLRGEHNIPSMNNTKIEWFSSYSDSKLEEPDLRFANNNILINPTTGVRTPRVTNRNNPGRYFRTLDEFIWDSKVHVSVPFNLKGNTGKLKFGGANTQWERDYREDRYEYQSGNSFRDFDGNFDGLFVPSLLGFIEGDLKNYVDLSTQLPNIYSASRQIIAGYVMAEIPLSEKLQLTTGLRYEQTIQELESEDPQVGVNGLVEYDDLNDLLPSFNLKYELVENTNLRFSYSRTVARPTFRELAPLGTFGFQSDNIQNGNPELERTLIDNLDVRFEKYPNPGEYFGASLFFKNFTDPIENSLVPQAGGSSAQFIYRNVDAGLVYGLELEARKSLSFISDAFKYFKVTTNLSLIYSQVDFTAQELAAIRVFNPGTDDTREMFMQSPYVFNASLIYDNFDNGWSGTIAFNQFGKRLRFTSFNLPFVFEQPRADLNLSVKKQLNERWSARFRANNLINPEYRLFMDYNGVDYDFNNNTRGRTFSVSITYLIE